MYDTAHNGTKVRKETSETQHGSMFIAARNSQCISRRTLTLNIEQLADSKEVAVKQEEI